MADLRHWTQSGSWATAEGRTRHPHVSHQRTKQKNQWELVYQPAFIVQHWQKSPKSCSSFWIFIPDMNIWEETAAYHSKKEHGIVITSPKPRSLDFAV